MGRIYSNYEEHEFESEKNWVLVHLRFRSIV